jgi:hypothetical protein
MSNRASPERSRRASREPSRTVCLAAALLCVAGYVFVYATGRAAPPIRSDGYSHYVYLPAWFIYGDPSLSAVADDCCGGEFPAFTAIIRWPDSQRWVNAHPIGVAILQAPFFLIAHALTKWTNLSPDGFTLYYQHAAGLAGTGWTIAGLFVMRALLRRRVSDRVAAVTLVVLLFGTNLYHYATFDSTYSHPYSFFLVASFLYLTERWMTSRATNVRDAALLGIVAGLIVLTRHTNALFLILFPLYGVTDRASARAAAARLWTRRGELAWMAAVALLTVAPQLAIYYQATGQLLVNSYGDLGFTFLTPHLWGVLFSVTKGVFFWSPILLAGIIGLAMGRPVTRAFALGAAMVLVVDTYLIASWWDWQFGASYGHRGFIDMLPLFALGLAAFFEWSAERATRQRVVAAIAVALVALSSVQMLQYWNGVMPMSDTTWDQYRARFLRLR